MGKLKEQIEKMEKGIESLLANRNSLKEEMKNNNTVLKKEIEDKVVLVLEKKAGWKI